MSYTRNANRLFWDQRRNAAVRDIAFKFTFSIWVKWWKDNLGENWMQKRGRKRGQYVMARLNDKGVYQIDNVKCVLAVINNSERKQNGTSIAGEKHPKCQFTHQKGLTIRGSKKSSQELADIYNISPITIRDIRARRKWQHL